MTSEVVRQGITVATSIVTLIGMWLAGSKRKAAWLVGLANQALWLVLIVVFQTWGLLILTAALVVIYSRNYLLWRAEEEATAP